MELDYFAPDLTGARFHETINALHRETWLAKSELGWFVLGSMRVERDFQYWEKHLDPYTAAPFRVAEESLLVADVGSLPDAERPRHLGALNASGVGELRDRLLPSIEVLPDRNAWLARIESLWPKVAVRRLDEPRSQLHPDETLHMQVAVRLGELDVSDIVVECVVSPEPRTDNGTALGLEFEHAGRNEAGEAIYQLDFEPSLSGLQSYQIRLYPYHELLSHRFEVGRMLWL